MKPFGFHDYVKLELEAFCVLSDSGTLTEEAAILGFPAVMMRESHERPEGMDAGVLAFSGLKQQRVIQAIELAVARARVPVRVPDYDDANVSEKVALIILSHVDHVRRTRWYELGEPS